jgi:hypothetical protein
MNPSPGDRNGGAGGATDGPLGEDVQAPHRVHAIRIAVGDEDLPEDRFSDHVNNARYFVFINRCFQGWYVVMGIR